MLSALANNPSFGITRRNNWAVRKGCKLIFDYFNPTADYENPSGDYTLRFTLRLFIYRQLYI